MNIIEMSCVYVIVELTDSQMDDLYHICKNEYPEDMWAFNNHSSKMVIDKSIIDTILETWLLTCNDNIEDFEDIEMTIEKFIGGISE